MRPAAVKTFLEWGRLVIIATAMVTILGVAVPAQADVAGDLTWSATIGGRQLAEIDTNQPLQLGADDQVAVTLDLQNTGTETLRVRSARLDGRVLGLSFYSYTVRMDIELEALQSTRREFNVDLDALTSQATGVIPSYFTLIGPDRNVIAQDAFPVDVQGSLLSVYGLFGLSVALVTLALLGSLLLSIFRGRFASRNRWQRALYFLPVGLGVGLTLTFTLSALRLLVPSATAWVPLVFGCGAVAFVIGYFLPVVRVDEDDQDLEHADAETDESHLAAQHAGDHDRADGQP